MVSTTLERDKNLIEQQGKGLRGTLIPAALVFSMAYLVLFLGMPLRPNVYDEGLVLTASMRVAAGQVPHRDFYFFYGPAQLYILAGLYRVFGQSILVERLLDLFFRSLLVASVYTIASSYFRKSVAACASLATLAWLLGLYFGSAGNAVVPISSFNLISTALIIPVFTPTLPARRIFAAGAIAGMATLFRYDTGIELLGIHACVFALGIGSRFKGGRLRAFVSTLRPYLPGFALVTLPPAFCYLSVAPLYPLVHDITRILGYYHRARNLPFPAISVAGFDNFAVYLPIAVVGISLYVATVDRIRERDNRASSQRELGQQGSQGYLIAFSLLAMAMYLKGVVRPSLVQMYLAITPSSLLAAALFQQRFTFRRPVRTPIMLVVWLSLLTPAWCSLRELLGMHHQHSSLPQSLWSAARGTRRPVETIWCRSANPATRGLCFLPEDDRIQTVEFIDSHTTPGQTIFVGVTHHDTIFINDNLIYFASHRLPATRWSSFDPDLQNRYDVQVQMVHEFDTNTPPYVVLDSEFDQVHEPNDSSRSSGVAVLDEYLHQNYRHVQTFGVMSVWQRIPAS